VTHAGRPGDMNRAQEAGERSPGREIGNLTLKYTPDIVVEWLTPLLQIREVLV
jgi:hypothetical protein